MNVSKCLPAQSYEISAVLSEKLTEKDSTPSVRAKPFSILVWQLTQVMPPMFKQTFLPIARIFLELRRLQFARRAVKTCFSSERSLRHAALHYKALLVIETICIRKRAFIVLMEKPFGSQGPDFRIYPIKQCLVSFAYRRGNRILSSN